MKQLLCLGLLLLLTVSISLQARNLPVKIGESSFTLLRDSGKPEQLPRLQLENKGNKDVSFRAETELVRPDGGVVERFSSVIKAGADESIIVDLFDGKRKEVKGEILLCHVKLLTDGGGKGEISGIFGTPNPVGKERAGLIGMNVHLSRYRASTRWKLLQMMKECGVTTVRVDSVFPDPGNLKARRDAIDKIRDDVLALEAFGMHPLVCIAYFNAPFFQSSEKQKMAYGWGREVAESVKGRTGHHFGNETNSGWSGFGAAADMAALNRAFALGCAAGDSGAERGSFGIAEGPVSYVEKFCETGAMHDLDAIAIHPYCGTPESGIAKSVAVRSAMLAQGFDREVWATEVGFHVDRGKGWLNQLTGELTGVTGFSLDMQRKLLPRLYLLAASHGVDRVYWYDFFGRGDPETFWLVQPDFTPRPAWHALKVVSSRLKDSRPLDHTPFDNVVQRHLYRKTDGSLLLACWAQKNSVTADFKLPPHCKVFNDLNEPVVLPANGVLQLGHGVFYVEGLSEKELPGLYAPQILLSGLDKRSFKEPTQRFRAAPGENFEVPVVVFNGSAEKTDIAPFLLRSIPGWRMILPDSFAVAPGENTTAAIKVEVPASAVPGVEYGLTVQARVNDLQLTLPYTVRVKVTGEFPFRAIRDFHRAADYPQWDSMNEAGEKTGNPLLEAENRTAAVDGDLSEWKPEEFYPIDQKFAGKLRDPAPVSDLDWNGKVALRWDKEYLYAAFLIQDDQLCFPDFLSRDWRDSDNVRLLLSAVSEREKRGKALGRNDLLLIMSPTDFDHTGAPRINVAALGGFVRAGAEKQIAIASKVWKDGYTLEVAIPVSLFNLKPESGLVIGLNVLADDCDDNHRQNVMMTRYENSLYWRSPDSTGNLKLK